MLRKINLNKLGTAPSFIQELSLIFLSGGLLISSFPRLELSFLIWFALIPFMLALENKSFKQSFWLSYLCGIIFFTGTLYWFFNITTWFSFIAGVGIVILILYFGLYFGAFGILYHYSNKFSWHSRILFLSCSWTVLEFIRAHLFTGFDWVSLAHSQYKNLMIIQIADATGFLGISFFIILTNLCLKEVIFNKQEKVFIILLLSWSIIIIYGNFRLKNSDKFETLKIAVIQGNINQEMKWANNAWPIIMRRHFDLTRKALLENPELIVWPETAFPGIVNEDKELFEQLQEFVREIHVPLLVGAIIKDGDDYFNSAILLDKYGQISGRYDKTHLVAFGEYLPLRKFMLGLDKFIPIEDFKEGKNYTVFELTPQKKFSVLICFEDTVSHVARIFAQNETGVFINITNDGWFKKSKASLMHFQSAVFRSIENRRSLVRCANTGISNFTNTNGKTLNTFRNQEGQSANVEGFAINEVPISNKKTFYMKYGNIFTYLCFVCILWMFLINRKIQT